MCRDHAAPLDRAVSHRKTVCNSSEVNEESRSLAPSLRYSPGLCKRPSQHLSLLPVLSTVTEDHVFWKAQARCQGAASGA